MEIERKFLLKSIPEDLDISNKHSISQGYINLEPVVRIRKYDDDYFLTIKSRGLLERIEVEKPITDEEFSELSKMVKGNLIEKDRCLIKLNDGYTLELDIFHGLFEGLIMAEIEYEDIEKARSHKTPDYLSCEVTDRPEYQNSSLSNMNISDIPALLSSDTV